MLWLDKTPTFQEKWNTSKEGANFLKMHDKQPYFSLEDTKVNTQDLFEEH